MPAADRVLRDLFGHQAWADAEHWRALAAHPPALDDPGIRERLHHIHVVQQAYLAMARGEPVQVPPLEGFPTMAALEDYGRRCHEETAAFLDQVSEARLDETIVLPWRQEPPIRITVFEGLMQAATHSHYHRAQNAARLRELGGQPPLTDLLIWYWKGRPAPQARSSNP